MMQFQWRSFVNQKTVAAIGGGKTKKQFAVTYNTKLDGEMAGNFGTVYVDDLDENTVREAVQKHYKERVRLNERVEGQFDLKV